MGKAQVTHKAAEAIASRSRHRHDRDAHPPGPLVGFGKRPHDGDSLDALPLFLRGWIVAKNHPDRNPADPRLLSEEPGGEAPVWAAPRITTGLPKRRSLTSVSRARASAREPNTDA